MTQDFEQCFLGLVLGLVKEWQQQQQMDEFYKGKPRKTGGINTIFLDKLQYYNNNKPIQDGGEAKAPLWLNRLSGTN